MTRACRHVDVESLSVAETCARPRSIPVSRPRGTKGMGLRYERIVGTKVKAAVPHAMCGPWFRFEDRFGPGYCQPDVVMYNIADDNYVVLECKLTNIAEAYEQLTRLYLPVVQRAFGFMEPRGIIVVKHLTNARASGLPVYESLRQAMHHVPYDSMCVWHYIGRGPIFAGPAAAAPIALAGGGPQA